MVRWRFIILASTLSSSVALSLLAGTAGAQEHEFTSATVPSRLGDIDIDLNVCRPAGADALSPVPVMIHSHGWGGSKSGCGSFVESWLDHGIGVVSWTQRGHGNTGGQRNVHDPEIEGQDGKAVIDFVASLPWVAHDVDGAGDPIPTDPVIASTGGSYGGGWQWLTALTEIRDEGRTRLNAVAPDICWFDLPEALAPQGVVRNPWTTGLYATAIDTFPTYVHEGFVTGAALGWFPDGTVPGTIDLRSIFHKHGPAGFVDGSNSDDGSPVLLDVPALVSQGMPDTLFNLNEAWHNFERTLTQEARGKSVFIGHNGGHKLLPIVLPMGDGASGESCAPGGRTAYTRAFFQEIWAGRNPRETLALDKPYNLTTPGGECVSVDSLSDWQPMPVNSLEVVVTPAGAGPIQYVELLDGPVTIAGVPRLRGTVTSTGVDARAFFGLAVGTSATDAVVVQDNLMPLRRFEPADRGAAESIDPPGVSQNPVSNLSALDRLSRDLKDVVNPSFTIELPGVAVDVPAGQKLFLVVSPVSDIFVGFQSRTPSSIVVTDAFVDLPVATPIRYLHRMFEYDVEHDVVYGEAVNNRDELEQLELDLYTPRGDVETNRPAFIWAHGGSFKTGDKKAASQAREMAKRGWVTASINYRVRPNGTPGSVSNQELITSTLTEGEHEQIREARHDMQAAVRWFRANADDLGIDPERIVVSGSSAGAVMALFTAFNPEDPGQSGSPDFPSDVSAAVSFHGAADGRDIEADAPPILMFHGTNDVTVPFALGAQTCTATLLRENTCEFRAYPTGGHGGYDSDADLGAHTAVFLCREVLGGCGG